MVQITVDTGEVRCATYQHLLASGSVEVSTADLPCGDYILGEGFAVERKDAVDFIASIMDARLFGQVKRMKDEFQRVVFLLERDPFKTPSGMQPEAIRGAISYLMAIEGVSVVNVPTPKEAAELMMTMARHVQEGLGYIPALRGAKPKNVSDLQQFLIEGLPGIGPKTAQGLLQHFGSARAVFSASAEELLKAPGIGKVSAQKIVDLLSSPTSGQSLS